MADLKRSECDKLSKSGNSVLNFVHILAHPVVVFGSLAGSICVQMLVQYTYTVLIRIRPESGFDPYPYKTILGELMSQWRNGINNPWKYDKYEF